MSYSKKKFIQECIKEYWEILLDEFFDEFGDGYYDD